MPGLGRDVVWQIAERECFRFHFQVDLRVNVRGVQGDMENDGRLEHAQQMAGHESPRTTKLYDRTKD
jgi:hypothetical protein